jgi:hypothetical protein
MAQITSLKPLWDGFAYKTHQIAGVDWMLKREDSDFPGGLLCDEMGLGKTMEILGLVKNSKKHNTLILCPKAVIMQWCVAAEKSKFNVFHIEGSGWHLKGAHHSGRDQSKCAQGGHRCSWMNTRRRAADLQRRIRRLRLAHGWRNAPNAKPPPTVGTEGGGIEWMMTARIRR